MAGCHVGVAGDLAVHGGGELVAEVQGLARGEAEEEDGERCRTCCLKYAEYMLAVRTTDTTDYYGLLPSVDGGLMFCLRGVTVGRIMHMYIRIACVEGSFVEDKAIVLLDRITVIRTHISFIHACTVGEGGRMYVHMYIHRMRRAAPCMKGNYGELRGSTCTSIPGRWAETLSSSKLSPLATSLPTSCQTD